MKVSTKRNQDTLSSGSIPDEMVNNNMNMNIRDQTKRGIKIPRKHTNICNLKTNQELYKQQELLQIAEITTTTTEICKCLKTRQRRGRGEHEKGDEEEEEKNVLGQQSIKAKLHGTHRKYYNTDNRNSSCNNSNSSCGSNNSISSNLNNTITTNSKICSLNSATINHHPCDCSCSRTTASVTTLNKYNNTLQHLFASLVWHITASTAISFFATFYYFIANTQGVSAVLALAATTATSSFASASSLMSSPSSSSSSASSSPYSSLEDLSFYHATNPTTTHYPNTSSSSSTSNTPTSSGSSQIPSSLYLDLNYSNINTTEITILNGFSSLATNKASVYSNNMNNMNTINNINNNNNNNNIITTVTNTNVISLNDSLASEDDMSAEDAASEYIFDRTDVRIIFITLYTMVFCCCFFGNLLVILVVTLSRRLRSITNFFLANLALADFCVGLFCVMQNLSIYLIDSWVFGEFLCRMYQFVHSLSYTASIFILVVICMERYFAIVHPITCKQILTAARLRMVILTVWITSAVYSTPKFVFSKTIKNVHTESGREEEICVLDRKMFNSKLLDMINFGLLYCIPLLVMTILYSKIAIALWRSSRGLQHHLNQQENGMGLHNSMYHHHHNHNNHHQHLHSHQQQQQQQQQQQHQQHHQQQPQHVPPAQLGTPISVNSSVVSGATLSRKHSCKYEKRGVSITESQVSLDADRPVVSACRKTSFFHNHFNTSSHPQHPPSAAAPTNQRSTPHQHSGHGLHGSQRVSHISHSSNNVLRARRGVVRMLIIFVLTFALCNLPYHARKMWQYWSRSYRGDSNFNALLTPLTFLVTYFNSGINPLLYAFLSRNFRKGMKELLMCSWRKSKTKSSTNSSMHHKRHTTLQHSLPTDTTHIGNEQL